MRIKTPKDIKIKEGWLFKISEKLEYIRTINAFNKEMRKVLREGGDKVTYYNVNEGYQGFLCSGWKLRAKMQGNRQAIKDLEKVYETGLTIMNNRYFDLTKVKEVDE